MFQGSCRGLEPEATQSPQKVIFIICDLFVQATHPVFYYCSLITLDFQHFLLFVVLIHFSFHAHLHWSNLFELILSNFEQVYLSNLYELTLDFHTRYRWDNLFGLILILQLFEVNSNFHCLLFQCYLIFLNLFYPSKSFYFGGKIYIGIITPPTPLHFLWGGKNPILDVKCKIYLICKNQRLLTEAQSTKLCFKGFQK